MNIKKPKFKKNPLCNDPDHRPGILCVWQYVPPGSSAWTPTHYLLVFQGEKGELFDAKAAVAFLANNDESKEKELLADGLFDLCMYSDGSSATEVLRETFTTDVKPSPRLVELIESANIWECFDGDGARGRTHFDNEAQRNVAAEINSLIQKEFFKETH